MESGRIRTASMANLISRGLDLLAQVLRRAPDHQPGDEDGDQRHHHHAVEAGADAARHDLAELDEEQGDAAAERHVGCRAWR